MCDYLISHKSKMSVSAIFTPPQPVFPQSLSGGMTKNVGIKTLIGATLPQYPTFTEVMTLGSHLVFAPTTAGYYRLTYAVNCRSGLPNNEHILAYGGLDNGVIQPKCEAYTFVYPFVKGGEGIGGGIYPSTFTLVDRVDVVDVSLPYKINLYLATTTGPHNVDLDIFVSAELMS